MKLDKRLIQIGTIATIIYLLYLFVGSGQPALPLPTHSKDGAFAEVENEVTSLGLPTITKEEIYYTNIIAHSSVGRYMAAHSFTEDELGILGEEISLYSYELASVYMSYQYDLAKKQLTQATNIYLEEDANKFVQNYFGSEYKFAQEVYTDSVLNDWTLKQTYEAPTSFEGVQNVVEVYLDGSAIVGFKQYGLATDFPEAEESIIQIFASLFIILFLIALTLFVTIHLIIKLVRKEIEAFWEPFGLTMAAAFGWLFLNKAMGTNLMSIGILESFIMIYLTFVSLLIRWKRPVNSLFRRLNSLRPSIVHGLLLNFIGLLLAEAFFYIASYFDTWVSPVTMYNVLLELNIWYIPIFTLFIGLSAAITEEAIFRHYMVPIFGRFGVVTALVATSFLWGIMHIGYDMYPWYIYVLEFILVTGPFFFFVYKRYGFSTAIFMHYFYNAFVTTLFLISVDFRVAFVSLLVMLSPFLLFLIGRKSTRTV